MPGSAAEKVGGRTAAALGLLVLLVLVLVTAGCSDDATPLDQTTTSAQLTPHLLPPSDQMEELARQQCRDDPGLAVGEVNAVDPERPDQKLATVRADCAEVRAGRSGLITSTTGPPPTAS